jgi:hypothetical protein
MSMFTRGGGKDKEPVKEKAQEVFGTKPFTYAEGHKFVSGYTRQIQTDLLNSMDLKIVPTPKGYIYNSLLSGPISFYGTSPKLYVFIQKNGTDDDKVVEKIDDVVINKGISSQE